MFKEIIKETEDLENFIETLENHLRSFNTYYDDLISGNVLRKLVISKVKKQGFNEYMKSQGKLEGQNKVSRMSNDRKKADEFYRLNLIEKEIEKPKTKSL